MYLNPLGLQLGTHPDTIQVLTGKVTTVATAVLHLHEVYLHGEGGLGLLPQEVDPRGEGHRHILEIVVDPPDDGPHVVEVHHLEDTT